MANIKYMGMFIMVLMARNFSNLDFSIKPNNGINSDPKKRFLFGLGMASENRFYRTLGVTRAITYISLLRNGFSFIFIMMI